VLVLVLVRVLGRVLVRVLKPGHARRRWWRDAFRRHLVRESRVIGVAARGGGMVDSAARAIRLGLK